MVSHEKVKMLIKDKQGKEGLLQFAVPIPDGTWEEIELNLGEAVNNRGSTCQEHRSGGGT